MAVEKIIVDYFYFNFSLRKYVKYCLMFVGYFKYSEFKKSMDDLGWRFNNVLLRMHFKFQNRH